MALAVPDTTFLSIDTDMGHLPENALPLEQCWGDAGARPLVQANTLPLALTP